jgi:hypothetical protein
MPKVDRLEFASGEVLLVFHCPGCQHGHSFRIQRGSDNDARSALWTWDGNYDCPTVSPSLLSRIEHLGVRCHLFVVKGTIQFLPDCSHGLKGKTLPMEDV